MNEQELRDLDKWIHVNVMEGDRFVGLMKQGLWYRPNAKGYTDRQSEAGRYTREEAKQHEYLHVPDAVTIREFDVRHYTTDPAAAMEVLKVCIAELDKRQDTICIEKEHGQYTVGSVNDNWEAISLSLETAVCLFAQRLFQKETP